MCVKKTVVTVESYTRKQVFLACRGCRLRKKLHSVSLPIVNLHEVGLRLITPATKFRNTDLYKKFFSYDSFFGRGVLSYTVNVAKLFQCKVPENEE